MRETCAPLVSYAIPLHRLPLEDSDVAALTAAIGGGFRRRSLGTWGRAGTFSFHGTKNIVAGEGGMLVTSDPDLGARAEVIREKGTDRSRFLRGDVDRYTWQMVGGSYLMSDLLAALVLAQWKRIDVI